MKWTISRGENGKYSIWSDMMLGYLLKDATIEEVYCFVLKSIIGFANTLKRYCWKYTDVNLEEKETAFICNCMAEFKFFSNYIEDSITYDVTNIIVRNN